ncbi:MAG TPA: amino acid ABC transporter permease [Acidimicrobiales bacterium]|nr:amino acid ABC transporter permease [Acidimicrobiales bacterium]
MEPAASEGGPEPVDDVVRAVPVRHPWRWVSAVAVSLVVAWILKGVLGVVDAATITQFQFSDLILKGLLLTVEISLLAQVLGTVLGVVLAVMRLSKNPVTSVTAWIYIWLFRGTPVLVQLLFWFAAVPLAFKTFSVGIPFTGVTFYEEPMAQFMTPFVVALLGLGLNEGAYMAEIVRAGILSVDEGQVEAAQALGMLPGRTMRRIVLPQAMRVIIPPTGNEFISMLKTSSLASVVLLEELLRNAQGIYQTNLKNLELLIVASLWYLALTTVASIGQYYLERRYARGAARELPDTPVQRLRRTLWIRTRARVED